jgi:OOP family OmpA-OmpF porin
MANNNGKQLFIGMLLGAAVLGAGPALAARSMGAQDGSTKAPSAKDGSMTDWGTPASGFYVGGAVSQSRFTNFSQRCDDVINLGAVVSDCDNTGFAWKAYGGYQYIRYFGVEVGYADFGKGRAKISAPAVGDVDFKARAVFLEGVVTVPIIHHLSFIAKGGGVRWNTKLNYDASLGLPSQSDNGWGSVIGAGFEYMFTPAFGMRAEYEFYNSIGDEQTTGKTNIQVISINGLLRF